MRGGKGKREEVKNMFKKYIWLAGINLFISTFTFGGGYIVVPMVRKYFVEKKKLFSEEELMEMAAIAQSSPGAIAVNMVSLAGYRTGGIMGMLISLVCALVPPIVILSVVSVCYSEVVANPWVTAVLKGMQAGAAALIVDFVVDMTAMIIKEHSGISNVLVLTAFFVSFFTDINVIFVLLGCCAVSISDVFIKIIKDKGGANEINR